jgi:hypothetical protein
MSQLTMFETRAQAIGISPKTLAARTRRTLTSVRKQIEALAVPWAEIDNSVLTEAQMLLRAFDAFDRYITETIDWLNQQPGA